jgi:ceramide glucosyltransferase
MFPAHSLMAIIGFMGLCLAAAYAVLALVARVAWAMHGAAKTQGTRPPVTILKPLCGVEPGLYEHLSSFCRQDYPEFQIVFGLRDPTDPACAVVQRLKAEFPLMHIDIVVNPQQHGSNRKTSNLINMFARARHDILAMADSDVFVGPDYLHTVTAPLMDPNVGLVTCIYQDIPTERIWSRLGAMYVNEWYVPLVLLGWLFGHRGYASGQTLCLRRDTLQAVGGLQAISNHLAEDYRLGELVRGLGQRIVLSPYVVKGQHHEQSLDSLTRHELRWMCTLRALQPRSFRLIFLTFTLPLALFGVIMTGAGSSLPIAAWTLCATTVAARLVLHFVQRVGGDRPLFRDFWLLPIRDLLVSWAWCQSFLTSQITWRGVKFDVGVDGVLRNERKA